MMAGKSVPGSDSIEPFTADRELVLQLLLDGFRQGF
jgi:hypothetical protein